MSSFIDPELRRIYLWRLERLVRLRREYDGELNAAGLKLLDRAIEATRQDAAEQGAAGAAADIVARLEKP